MKFDVIDGERRTFEGDLEVEGSIIGSRLYVKGSLKARQILRSEIFTFGNLEVSDLIQRATVFCGNLISRNCKVRSSDVYVERRMEVKEVGTFPPTPVKIYLGFRITMVKEFLKLVEFERRLKGERERLLSSLRYLSVDVGYTRKDVEKNLIRSVKDGSNQKVINFLFELFLNTMDIEDVLSRKKKYISMGVLVDEAVLRVSGTVFPEVTIFYGEEKIDVLDKAEGVEIKVRKGVLEK